jgi:predicted Zn-dependent peptidase
MCIIMAGDLNSDQVIAKIDKAFAYMKPKEVKPYNFEQEAPINQPIEASVFGPDAEYVNIAYRFPGASSPEAKLLNLMSSVLSNGTAGLMDLNLVKKQQVLSASAGAYILKDYSVLFLEGKAKEGQALENVRDLMLAQIEQIKKGNFEESMLKAIINNYRKSLIEQQESNSGRAYGLLDAFTSELDWADQIAMIDAMSKLSKQDIISFANKWLNQNYVCVYKRLGKDENVLKVDKPEITPVEVNRDAQSAFVKQIATMPAQTIAPKFVNYTTDIQRGVCTNNGNKVDVLSVKNNNNALFSQYYHLSMGSLNQPLLPYALDYLQYLGTNKYSADDISSMFYTLACDFGVSSSDEETYVYLNGLQDNYTEALDLFEHLLANCEPNEEALKEMIAGAKKKRADAKLNKNAIRRGLVSFAQYGARNPFNNKLSNQALDKIKATDLIAILKQLSAYPHKVLYYGPASNTAIAASLSKQHALPATFKPVPPSTPYTYQTQTANQILFADYDMVQAEIQWFRNDVMYNPTMEPVQSMFNEYFGGNMSGIVFQEIRESKALAYSTYAVFSSPAYKNRPHTMMAYVGCQADKMKEALAGMQSLIDTLPQSEKLFRQSQQSIKNTISTTRTTKANILFSYLNAQKKGLNYDMNSKLFQQVGQFAFADIRNFHQQHIAKKPYTLTVVGNDKKLNWSALNKYGPVKKLTLTDIFGY